MKYLLLILGIMFYTNSSYSQDYEIKQKVNYVLSTNEIKNVPSSFYIIKKAEYFGVKITLENRTYNKSKHIKDYIKKTIDSVRTRFPKSTFLYSDNINSLLEINNFKKLYYLSTSRSGKTMSFYCLIELQGSLSELDLILQHKELKAICNGIAIPNNIDNDNKPDFYRSFTNKPTLALKSLKNINQIIDNEIINEINSFQSKIDRAQKIKIKIPNPVQIYRASFFELYISKNYEIELISN